MKRNRRTHDAQFKARVALEAFNDIKTVQQIASDYEVHPLQVSEWKRKSRQLGLTVELPTWLKSDTQA